MSKSNLLITRKRRRNHGYCEQHVSFNESLFCIRVPWTGQSPGTILGRVLVGESNQGHLSSNFWDELFEIVLRIPDLDRTNDARTCSLIYVKETFNSHIIFSDNWFKTGMELKHQNTSLAPQ